MFCVAIMNLMLVKICQNHCIPSSGTYAFTEKMADTSFLLHSCPSSSSGLAVWRIYP